MSEPSILTHPARHFMGFFDFFRPRIRLTIGDCSQRTLSSSANFPVLLNGKSASGRTVPLCRIHSRNGEHSVEPLNPSQPIRLDGAVLRSETPIESGRTYGLSLSSHLIVIRISRSDNGVDSAFTEGRWNIAPRVSPTDRETLPENELRPASLMARYADSDAFLAFPSLDAACFSLSDLIASLPRNVREISTEPQGDSIHNATPPPANGEARAPRKRSTGTANAKRAACPYCWKPFAAGDALNIATHDSLTGDPVLGQHAKLRFAATRFNEVGQALDAEGTTSVDLACPHCRGRLPPSFFQHNQLILSLVGAPSSGKSYFLSVLLRLLPEELIRHFGANLQDGDPTGNAQLNEMKNRLFSATSPDDAFISKTDFEGVMYERLHRDGKLVSLPRPFVYYLQRFDQAQQRASLVFYDNAGEHFKPGVALDDSPGALHVAASAGLLFLFDPSTHPAFRKLLRRKRDPQLRTHATDEQDTILAELGVRVKKMRGLESHEQVVTPLAIMVGKFDLWSSLLPVEAIHAPEERPLTTEELESNSAETRKLLGQLCPTIVANAEALSRNVRYFPISPLGHSPKEIEEGPLAGRLAPNPKRLKPILATAPILWVLSEQAPQLLGRSASAAWPDPRRQ